MKKILLYTLILYFGCSYCLFAQNADIDYPTIKDTVKQVIKNSKNNTDLCDNEDDEEEDKAHEFISNLYGDFDTTVVHQYKFKEIFKETDSIKVSFKNDKFVIPFNGIITSKYGWRKYRPHYGTDIDLEKGDTVRCAFDGVVRYASKKVYGYGQVVIIRHRNGLETIYAHLSKILVSNNDTIYAGEVLGLGGNTGRSHGAHLHFETRCLGLPINPEDLIDFHQQALKSDYFILTKKDAEETYNLRSKKYHKYIKGKGGIYIVRKGDTLSKISRKTGVPIARILKRNKLKKNAILKAGKKLYL